MRQASQEQDDHGRGACAPAALLAPRAVEQAVRDVDPTAFFVLPRVLRRVIKHDRDLTGFVFRVPHRKSYAIDAAPLLEIVDRSELLPDDELPLPDRIILLPSPAARKFAEMPPGELLTYYWRLLFHMRIHAALEQQVADGVLSEAVVRRRIQQLGPAAFDEIRLVLQQEDYLLPPLSDTACYVEFAAVYLELQRFCPSLLGRYFPGLVDLKSIDAVLAEDVDADDIFQATALSGAAYPLQNCDLAEEAVYGEAIEPAPPPVTSRSGEPSATKCRALMRRSRRPAAHGNVVRAAIFHARAEQCVTPELSDRVQDAIKMDVYRLTRRLQAALELESSGPPPWRAALFALVRQTVQGLWTRESRLLYDLQKVCVDCEREVSTIDVMEWALSRGRRPVKRLLPHQRGVLMVKHLRSAARRLPLVHLSNADRTALAAMLTQACTAMELRLRERLRPLIAQALEDVGLTPQNIQERVARKKLVEELLDEVVERGYFRMGSLRDAISRNNLKLPDISRPGELFHGDPLLRADRQLAVALDGIYYAGESYLRGMQRLSSLAFGTRTGRFLTRFAAVPFGGAYLALAGLHHLGEMLGIFKPPPHAVEQTAAVVQKTAGNASLLVSPVTVVLLGLLLMGLINSARFRQVVARFFRLVFRVLKWVVVEPLRWLLQAEWLQYVLHSRLFRLILRFGVKPTIWTCIAWWLLPLDDSNWQMSTLSTVSVFMAANLLLNSRVGRLIEEVAIDWCVQTWHRFGLRIITGLFWLIVDVFKRILETVEWLMYSVDEWLQFRSGQSSLVLVLKGGIGIIWFLVAYILRFSVNLLIEPQINPIKHFPVVTVSHKLLLPLIPSLAGVLELTMEKGWAYAAATAIIAGIPGIFGFLVWELKENWRLYAANRHLLLGPAAIGSHGETMARFLKLGFHSGTLPKRFARLRRAERKAWAGGSWTAVHKHLHALHHVEIALYRYVEREFNELFTESSCWQTPPPVLEEIEVAAASVRMSFAAGDGSGSHLCIMIAAEAGWLSADVIDPGWVAGLAPSQRAVFTTALIGLYKSLGVDVIRQQVRAAFQPAMPAFDLTATGLAVWPEEDFDVEVFYDLHEPQWIAPQAVRGLSRHSLPTLPRTQLVFNAVPVTWKQWVEIWQPAPDCDGQSCVPIVPVTVLP